MMQRGVRVGEALELGNVLPYLIVFNITGNF